jgi:hypothetical protein
LDLLPSTDCVIKILFKNELIEAISVSSYFEFPATPPSPSKLSGEPGRSDWQGERDLLRPLGFNGRSGLSRPVEFRAECGTKQCVSVV